MSQKTYNLDWLAEEVCDVLESRLGKVYADGVRNRLDGVDRFQVVLWLNNLDDANLKALADKLNRLPRAERQQLRLGRMGEGWFE